MQCIHHIIGRPCVVLPLQALERGRWVLWSLFAIALIVAPLLFRSSLAHTMLSQMGIAIIACLAYNMLLGQGGMLSFGHAVYTGLGSFLAIHTLNMVTKGSAGTPLPVSLIPLVGGLAGAVLCRACWVCDHQEVWHHLRHDHAGCGRTGVGHVADVPRVLRRRRRHLGRPRRTASPSLASPSGRRSRCIT
jgi:hypothetical protein